MSDSMWASIVALSAQHAEFSKFARQLDGIRETAVQLEKFVAPLMEVQHAWKRQDAELLARAPGALALGRLGWTLPMLLPITTVPELLDAAHDESEDIDALFREFYDFDEQARLNELLRSIAEEPGLAMWAPLIAECVASLQDGRFRVPLPALLSVFEGTLAVALSRFEKKLDAKLATARRSDESKRVMEILIWRSIEGFCAELYRAESFAGPAPSRVNRNWVLHGRAIPDASKIDSLRLLQAIHTTASQIRWTKA